MPQIGVEIQFLGIQFALLRAILTFLAIISIGTITNYLIVHKGKDEKNTA